MDDAFLQQLFEEHHRARKLPSPRLIEDWLDGLLQFLFPELSTLRFESEQSFRLHYLTNDLKFYSILDAMSEELTESPDAVRCAFEALLPSVRGALIEDAEAILAGDPAAVNRVEVITTYPGFYALAVHRIAHAVHGLGACLLSRMLSEIAHGKTGIEIHPAADIGRRFCIDHGTGIVIGETVRIGNDVKMYQGVTLGALSVQKEMARTKRHPTIEDGVVIYAGATILGGDTVIGANSVIGGNTWIVKSVPPDSRIYYREPRID
ncbi:serine O-acetyltransferase [Lewinella marina]|uniref:Serine acetyltransferase n=1 Tax=Neolewinella marina TaxID=438751 RepID=A0A2G0CK06_9BACT|nr:serine O-acetyltransferase EpsC [Neolewinella marina]NJB84557.1 serine O-acetyltransferase [Neolewinella marina]PHL00261.1 serine acetyltransferase [Neolewinella marina]